MGMTIARTAVWVVILLLACVMPGRAADQHSVEAIKAALESPIPPEVVRAAQEADDEILKSGQANESRIYLVTDERSKSLNSLVDKLLRALGEKPSDWVVRVLDTEPKTVNAFVFGGKYIYAYTGFLAQAQSEDEVAFVLSHEIAHSKLKHDLRKQADSSTTIQNLAIIVAALSGGATKERMMAIAGAIAGSYSQDDEREADAFGTAIALHAGYDPLRGADFFTRAVREQDEQKANRERELLEYRNQVLALKANCESLQHQWNQGVIEQSDYNAKIVNDTCGSYQTHAAAYNSAAATSNSQLDAGSMPDVFSTHPPSQERVATIAAVTDYLRKVRSIAALQSFQQAQRVMQALSESNHVVLQASSAQTLEEKPVDGEEADKADVKVRLQQLQDLKDEGLISDDEFVAKRKAILGEL